jgi:hypothetical protein
MISEKKNIVNIVRSTFCVDLRLIQIPKAQAGVLSMILLATEDFLFLNQ